MIVTRDLLTCGLSSPRPFFDRVHNLIQDLSQHSLQGSSSATASAVSLYRFISNRKTHLSHVPCSLVIVIDLEWHIMLFAITDSFSSTLPYLRTVHLSVIF